MKISTKTRYGLRALIYIAEETANDEEKLVRIKEISENQKLSVQYLEQILFKLKKSKIIVVSPVTIIIIRVVDFK